MAEGGRNARGQGCAHGALVALAAAAHDGPVVIIDNYDSFTYNLSQVRNFDPIP